MDRIITLALLAVLACLPTACTHNDGNIGDLYGRWQLTEMQVADSTATPDDLFFSFQSTVIFVSVNHYELHEAIDYTGSYAHVGDSLFIRMVPHDSVGEGLRQFMATRWGMPDHSHIRLRIEEQDKKRMRLSHEDDYWQFRKF